MVTRSSLLRLRLSSRRALSLLLLHPDQLQLFFALLVVGGQTLVLLQQLLVLLHQTGRVLLVLLVLVQLGDELLPAHRRDGVKARRQPAPSHTSVWCLSDRQRLYCLILLSSEQFIAL